MRLRIYINFYSDRPISPMSTFFINHFVTLTVILRTKNVYGCYKMNIETIACTRLQFSVLSSTAFTVNCSTPGRIPQSRPVSHIPWLTKIFREAKKRNTRSKMFLFWFIQVRYCNNFMLIGIKTIQSSYAICYKNDIILTDKK